MNTAPSTSAAVASVPQAGTSGSSGLPAPVEKDKDAQWYFTAEELANSPSRRQGFDSDMELSCRQMTAYLIQEMGQRLKVSQLCINTAIVYMHRFYAFHSFTHFHRNSIASASLFLAAKVEEQPRKLEHVIKAANKCLNQPVSNTVDAQYLEAAQDLVFNENVLLQTLGFDVAIDHPHTHVVKTCHLVKACKDLTKTSYFLASNSLHLTSMCLQYRPTVVACFCIYLACKWSRWEIPQSTEGKHWFHYVDRTVTMELLKQLTDEFIAIYEKSPARLKSKLNSIKALAQGASNNRPVAGKDGKRPPAEEWKVGDMLKMYHSSITISENSNQSGDSAELQQQFNNNAAMQHSPHAMPMMSILPPPPPAQQQQQHLQKQQQMRKSDMQAGQQHRQQSSSHHSKHGFPPVGDMTDHKSNYKNQQPQSQQQNFNGNNQNAAGSSSSYGSSGRMREHPQVAQQQQTGALPPPQSMGQVQRSNMSMSTSNRTSGIGNSNSSHQTQPANMRQQMPSGMPMDGQQNYQQKIRERSSSMHSIPNSLHNQMPPHAAASTQQHKLSSKSDVGSSGRMLAPKDSSKHKLYSSSGSLAAGSSNAQTSSGMREFANSQGMTAQAGVGGKMDNPNSGSGPHELPRGMMPHNQRSSYANSGNNNNTNNMSLTNPVLSSLSYNVPPPALPQQQQQQQSSQHRQAHTNMKLEHSGSKSLSGNSSTVHNQSQMHKSNLASEPAYSNATQHDLAAQQQQQMYPPQQSSAHAFASMMRSSSGAGSSFDNMLGEDPLNSLYASGMLQQAHPQMKPSTTSSDPTSMYGTDWAIQQMMNIPANSSMPAAAGGGGNNNTNETNGSSHRAPPHIKTELSPRTGLSSREKERDRIKVSPSTKKEKHRHSSSSAAAAAASSAFPSNIEPTNINKSMQQQPQQTLQQQFMYKKPDPSIDQLATAPVAGNKRSMHANIKQEDDALRESKQAKMDPMAAAMLSESKMVSQVVNGIETNPDLVRSLLKESLSANSALIKGEPLLTAPDTKPPAELFATPFDNQQHHAPPSTTYTQSSSSSSAAAAALASGTQLTASNEAIKPTVAVATVQQASDNATTATLAEEPSSSKDREKHKKNKKDKHKHKEKDKSKERDREERKKHKKDKDRHKDKERDSEREQPRSNNDRPAGETEQLKIKIRKDQIGSSSLNLPPFKIKIPKERIKGDLHFGGGGGGGANGAGVGGHLNQFPGSNATGSMATGSNNRLTVAAATAAATDVKPHNPTLKIKISKDKIEGYTGCAYQQQPSHTATSMPANISSSGATVSSFASTFDPTAAQQNQNFYASFFASQHQPQQQHQQIHAPSTSIGSSMSSHSHTHYSSSSGGGGSGSSKKKDRDRDRSKERDRERDKKRHCAESGRTATGAGGGSNMGALPNVTTSSSSHGHGNHPPRTHSTNRH